MAPTDETTHRDGPPLTHLEQEKLRLEIREMSRPWWRRPGYIGIILPLILAIATVVVSYRTQYFSAVRERLEAKADRLAVETAQLEQKKQELQDEENQLREEISQLKLERRNLQDRVKQERQKARLATMRTHLEALEAASPNLSPKDYSVQALIRLLRASSTPTEGLKPLKTYLKRSEDVVLQAHILYILYKGAKKPEWRDQLLSQVVKEPLIPNRNFWDVFSKGDWSEDWARVASTLARALKKAGTFDKGASGILESLESVRVEELSAEQRRGVASVLSQYVVAHIQERGPKLGLPTLVQFSEEYAVVTVACVAAGPFAWMMDDNPMNSLSRNPLQPPAASLQKFKLPVSTGKLEFRRWLESNKELAPEFVDRCLASESNQD